MLSRFRRFQVSVVTKLVHLYLCSVLKVARDVTCVNTYKAAPNVAIQCLYLTSSISIVLLISGLPYGIFMIVVGKRFVAWDPLI